VAQTRARVQLIAVWLRLQLQQLDIYAMLSSTIAWLPMMIHID